MNGNRIPVHKEKPLYFVVGRDISGISPDTLQILSPIISAPNHIRHFGAVALELAIFARGLVDLLVDLRDTVRITDFAAGYVIAQEAGGLVVDQDGKVLDSELDYDRRISLIRADNKEPL